jgi:hypothetical protein
VFDDITVLGGLDLEQLPDHHHTLRDHRLCNDFIRLHLKQYLQEDFTHIKLWKDTGQRTNQSINQWTGSLPHTVSVGEQQHQSIEAGVCDLRDVGGTPAYGLDGTGSKLLVLALHICLEKAKHKSEPFNVKGNKYMCQRWVKGLNVKKEEKRARKKEKEREKIERGEKNLPGTL